MKRSKWMLLVSAAAVLGCVGSAEAEGEAPPDLLAIGHTLKAHIAPFTSKPAQGWDGREYYAWKVYLRPRARKMNARVRKLLEAKWLHAKDDGRIIALHPSQWLRAIQEMAGLHVELAAAKKGYGKINVSEKRAIRAWDKKHKMPSSIHLSPSYPLLTSLRGQIAHYRREGWLVPTTWIHREAQLLQACQAELVARQRAFKAKRLAAHADMKARADATRAALAGRMNEFAGAMDLAGAWMALLQAAEEQRLRKEVQALEGEAKQEALRNLGKMEAGRRAAQGRFTSDYGSLLRQKWSGPRTKVLNLLKKAATAEAK